MPIQPMDPQLQWIYVDQIMFQCLAVSNAAADIDWSLRNQAQDQARRLWYGVNNLVVAAGNLQKILWGQRVRDRALRVRRDRERAPLREICQVNEGSPLYKVVIRNDLEHIDERLEEWWRTSETHNYSGEIVGSPAQVQGLGDRDLMRWFDPETTDLVFWANSMNLRAVFEECQRILPLLVAWRSVPLWQRREDADRGGC
jgi:hypothetical protein